MPKLTFRRATVADANAVREITRAAYAKWIAAIGRELAPIEVIPTPPHTPSYLLIENVAVLPDWQGTGLGGVLLGRAEAIARSIGLSELRLYTNAKFSTNVAFYARRGFEEFLREPHADGGEVVHMKRVVSGTSQIVL